MRQRDPRLRQFFNTAATFLPRLLPTRSGRNATLWLIVLVNLSLAVLYVWSRGGATTIIRIEAIGQEYRAFVDGELIGERIFQSDGQGGIGLLLNQQSRLPALPKPYGVDWVRLTDPETGEVIFEDTVDGSYSDLWENDAGDWFVEDGVFTSTSRRMISTGLQPWRSYIFEAKLRNVTEMTVFVHARDAGTAIVVRIQAFGGSTLAHSVNAASVDRLDNVRLELDRGQTLQSITAMLLRPYPVALLMFAGVVILAFVVRSRRLEGLLQGGARFVPEMATGVIVGLAAGTGVLLWYLLYVVGDAMPHVPDSVLYIFHSNIFASFNVTADAPPARESFSIFHPHMLQVVDGRWFTQYLFGHPMFLAAGQLLGAVWLVPPLLGALSVAMIYWVGKRLYGVSVGLLAAVLLFSSPFFLMTASNFMSHTTAAFTLIATLFLITLPTKHRLLAMFFAGVFMGLLFNNRPLTAIAFMPVLAGFMGYEVFRAGPVNVPSKPWLFAATVGAILVVAAAVAYATAGGLLALLVLSPLVIPAGFLSYNLFRDRTGRGDLFREDLAFAGGALLLFGAYLLYNLATTGDLGTTPYAAQGTFSSDSFGFSGNHSLTLGLQNEQELLSLMLLVANGWPLAIGLIVAAMPFMLGTRSRWDYFLAASFLAIATAPILYVNSAIMHGPRYWFETMPFLILLTARGAQCLASAGSSAADWLTARYQKGSVATSSGVAGLATYGMITGLVVFSLYGWLFGQQDTWGDREVDRRTPPNAAALNGFNFTDDSLLEEADRLDLENALVLVKNCPQWWCYGSVFWTNSPALEGNIVWAEQQTTGDDLTLMRAFPERAVYIGTFSPPSIVETTRAEITLAVEERIAEDPTLVPTGVTTTPEERDATRTTDLEAIQAVLEQYAQQNGSYPDTNNDLQSLCAYRTLDVGCGLESVGRIPFDPLGEPTKNGYWYRSDGQSYTLIALRETGLETPSTCPEELLGNDDRERTCVEGSLP